MKIDITGKERFLVRFLLVIVVLCLLYIVLGKFSERKYKKYYKDQIELLKNEKKELIEKSEKKIKFLIQDNIKKDVIIKDAFVTIDSLKNEKDKVKIKYVVRYRDIEKFNSEQVKKYWENEFKK